MSDQSIIQVEHLHKRYDDLHVLRDLNLEINAGEKVSIIGPSGSGKSTLLRLLMTLEAPNEGKILINGESLWTMEQHGKIVPANEAHLHQMRNQLGMVFQHFNLFPHLTVLKNITLAPELLNKNTPAEAEKNATELLELVGLSDKHDTYPAQLSGGQKQRVAIARALAMAPKIMLFDEVTSALDPELVGEVLNVLRTIAHESDMTMLLVTHEIAFAREISDRILFFDHGVIIEQGRPEEILVNPQHERTQEFLQTIL